MYGPVQAHAGQGRMCCMQRCVAPRRSTLSLFLLPPSWNCTPGPSFTFARSNSAWLCAVRTKAWVGPGMVCLPALCSGEPLRRAGKSSLQPRPLEKCDSHQLWENGPNTPHPPHVRVSQGICDAGCAPIFRASQEPCIAFPKEFAMQGF